MLLYKVKNMVSLRDHASIKLTPSGKADYPSNTGCSLNLLPYLVRQKVKVQNKNPRNKKMIYIHMHIFTLKYFYARNKV